MIKNRLNEDSMDAYSPSAPSYAYQEYPKWLFSPATGASVLVQNAIEEAALVGVWFNSKAEADAAQDKRAAAPNAALMAEFEKAIATAPKAISEDPDWTVEKCAEELCGYFAFADHANVTARITAGVEKLEAARQAAVEAQTKTEADAKAEINALTDQAVQLGMKIDGRWSAERLRQEIDKAQQATAKSGASGKTSPEPASQT